MIAFINTFLSYLILVIISMVIIVLGVICGKKLRESKDAKAAVSDSAASDTSAKKEQ